MGQRQVKRHRKEVRRKVNEFLEGIWTLPFRDRLKIAWRLMRGK